MQDGKTVADLHEEGNESMVDVVGKLRLDRGRIVFSFGPHQGTDARRRRTRRWCPRCARTRSGIYRRIWKQADQQIEIATKVLGVRIRRTITPDNRAVGAKTHER